MKAVQYAEHGGPEVLQVVEVEEPHAGPGEIRIAVRAAGVNPLDWKLRQGSMPGGDLPSGTGLDAAGVVDEVGEGVTGVSVGDAVFGFGSSTYAEHAVLYATREYKRTRLAYFPPEIDAWEAGALERERAAGSV